jgi:hypothetical protein
MTAELWATPFTPLVALLLGGAFAAGYLRLVRQSAEALVQGSAGPGRAVLGLSLRLLLALVTLGLAVRAGAGPVDLLAGTVGFALVRTVLLRRQARRE